MERQLKFRVWDKTADNPQGRGLKGVMICHDYVMDSDYVKDAINGKYPIMLFTGLTDKNGVDIYESDVVEYDEFARPCSRDGMRIEVKIPDIYLRINGMKNIKVIGNIHQDKNLLK